MNRRIQIVGIAIIALLTTGDLLAQRGRGTDRDRNRGNRDRVEKHDRGHDNHGRYRNNHRKKDVVVVRNGRTERVVRTTRVSRPGYRNHGYPARGGYTVVYDYDFRRGKRFRLNRAPRPSVQHIWVAGHWRFSARLGRDIWVSGGWAIKSPRHRYVAGHYDRFGGRRTWIPGCWTVIY